MGSALVLVRLSKVLKEENPKAISSPNVCILISALHYQTLMFTTEKSKWVCTVQGVVTMKTTIIKGKKGLLTKKENTPYAPRPIRERN